MNNWDWLLGEGLGREGDIDFEKIGVGICVKNSYVESGEVEILGLLGTFIVARAMWKEKNVDC